MIRHLFERKATHEAELLAEAQALIDDGLDLEFVLGLFPDDAEWLEPLLDFAGDIEDAFEGEPASYYFEASLKSNFIGAAREPKPVVPVIVAPPAFSPLRTAVATMSVASTAAAVGILALGFITAGDSVPGDWNYAFKLANERFEYSTSRGDSRIDVQIAQTQRRVAEFQKLSERGEVSQSQIESLQREFDEVARLVKQKDLDALQKAQFGSLGKAAEAVLNDAGTRQPELAGTTTSAAAAIGDTLTTALGAPPTPTVTATDSPTANPTAEATTTPTPPPSTPAPSASPTESPTPAETGTAEPSATSTEQPIEDETETPAASATP